MLAQLDLLYSSYLQEGHPILNTVGAQAIRNLPSEYFTYVGNGAGGKWSTGGGVALAEVFLLGCLAEVIHPKAIFAIGNAAGFSTVALAWLNNPCPVVALDAGCEGGDNAAGNQLTERIATSNRLNIRVHRGRSPEDVPAAAARLPQPPDLCLIDAWHDDAHQLADANAVAAVAAPGCVYLFHDVVRHSMEKSFWQFAQKKGAEAAILMRTPSGMGIVYPAEHGPRLQSILRIFGGQTGAPHD